ncbi:MAG TPA: septum formation initiator family protein [Solirubrobacterales bacterium]|nr:septum formation initiator family protein [Solirubrobacterales bacterium]
MLVIVIFAILVSYINPVINFVDSWTTARSERTALAEQKAENQRLRKRLDALDGAAAAERSARRIGMVLEGEQSYVAKGLGGG